MLNDGVLKNITYTKIILIRSISCISFPLREKLRRTSSVPDSVLICLCLHNKKPFIFFISVANAEGNVYSWIVYIKVHLLSITWKWEQKFLK